jgi:hypothetical protein
MKAVDVALDVVAARDACGFFEHSGYGTPIQSLRQAL